MCECKEGCVKDTTCIPKGQYCYTIVDVIVQVKGFRVETETCPYWEIRDDKPEHMNGYCQYLEKGDWEEDGTELLWDRVKCCSINLD
jgi:hypothetical protein